jgi:hypothetical protein
VSDQCLLRLELIGRKYVVVDQDGRQVHGVTALALETEPGGGLAEVRMSFIPFSPKAERIT